MVNHDYDPHLVFERCYSMVFQYPNGHIRKFIISTVRNTGEEEALSCQGRLYSSDTPESEYPIHWAGTPYTTSRVEAETIEILPGESRDLDIAFSIGGTIPPSISTAQISTSTTTTTHESLSTSGTVDPRFIVHGTGAHPTVWRSEDRTQRARVEGPRNGAWIALPLALSMPHLANQAKLEPGEYHVEVEVLTINGTGARCALTIISSENWEEMSFTSTLPERNS